MPFFGLFRMVVGAVGGLEIERTAGAFVRAEFVRNACRAIMQSFTTNTFESKRRLPLIPFTRRIQTAAYRFAFSLFASVAAVMLAAPSAFGQVSNGVVPVTTPAGGFA